MMLPGSAPSEAREYPVFIKRGDARNEVDDMARRLGSTPAVAGLHKTIYAAQANQTVVLVTHREAPLAVALRAGGWQEPREPAGPSGS
jgi:hypothetical protein